MTALAYLGVDPGYAQGALVLLSSHDRGVLDSLRISRLTHQEINDALSSWCEDYEIRCAIEDVGSMPGDARKSGIGKFLVAAGILEGLVIAHRIPAIKVAPRGNNGWQRHYVSRNAPAKDRKKLLRQKAQSLWPTEGIVQEDADAHLIADWARCHGKFVVG